MSEHEFIPVSQLLEGDRMFMGGTRLWGIVTAIVDEGSTVKATVSYDDGSQQELVRERGFRVRVDRGGASE